MSLQHTILGFLSWRPMSGYDLKRRFTESDFLHWQGNNNQIYRTLLELHRLGWVELEVQVQDKLPARKVYSISPAGRTELRTWLRTAPEGLHLRSGLLLRLAWAEELEASDLDHLLQRYEEEAALELAGRRETLRRGADVPGRSEREKHLWTQIAAHGERLAQAELAWLRDLRESLHDYGVAQPRGGLR